MRMSSYENSVQEGMTSAGNPWYQSSSYEQGHDPLLSAYQKLKQNHPNMDRRDTAQALGISEAELISHHCGVRAIRLNDHLSDLIQRLDKLGYLTTVTSNQAVIHSRNGCYNNIEISGSIGMVVAEDKKIDLRLLLAQWAFGFAVEETSYQQQRYSLQFFDKSGATIQQIYLTPKSNFTAFNNLIADFESPYQTRALNIEPNSTKLTANDSDVDSRQLSKDWQAMNDVHEFMRLLHKHRISRIQAFRLVDNNYAQSIATTTLCKVLDQAAKTSLAIMCFVSNAGIIQIHNGPIENVSHSEFWLNIDDEEFVLQVALSQIKSAWLTRKPTTNGVVTSLEYFNHNDELVIQFFGMMNQDNTEDKHWRLLAESTLI